MPVSKKNSKREKEYIKKRLSEIMPTLVKIGLGDFSEKLDLISWLNITHNPEV